MKFKTKLLLLSSFSIFLLGCGQNDSNNKKDNYSGELVGTATAITTPDGTAPSISPPQTVDHLEFGSNKRFTELSPSVLEDVQYISSPAIKYHFGQLVVNGKGGELKEGGQPIHYTSKTVDIVPFEGWIRYPKVNLNNSKKKFPVIVFLHGNSNPQNPSYQGYDYMAKTLAEQGYVVLSLDANAINGHQESFGDVTSQTRGQLILGTIDKLKQLDAYGGAGELTALKGKLDFTNIGIMGHSRGGQGIYLALKFNVTRSGNDIEILKEALVKNANAFKKYGELVEAAKINDDKKLLELMIAKNISFAKTTDEVKPYNFKAAFALAPTDFEQIKGITNVPLATLLPSCDGDVDDLQGAFNYDNNRFSLSYDTAPKYQIFVRGANHNYYNTTWIRDDYSATKKSDTNYCKENAPKNFRLNAKDQRKSGQFIINSFMRYFVGGEQKFKAYWNSTGKLPKTACPNDVESCDERVIMSVQKNASKLIQGFEQPNSLSINLLGGRNHFNGFKTNGIITCRSHLGIKDRTKREELCSTLPPKFYLNANTTTGGVISSADQIQLTWDQPNPTYSLMLNNLSTQGYDSLTFRVALPVDVGQEVLVEVTDIKGKTAVVRASDFSDALYKVPRKKANGIPLINATGDDIFKDQTAELLNMISIPLQAFDNIDTSYLSNVTFKFPKETGTVVMNDIQLQKLRN